MIVVSDFIPAASLGNDSGFNLVKLACKAMGIIGLKLIALTALTFTRLGVLGYLFSENMQVDVNILSVSILLRVKISRLCTALRYIYI